MSIKRRRIAGERPNVHQHLWAEKPQLGQMLGLLTCLTCGKRRKATQADYERRA